MVLDCFLYIVVVIVVVITIIYPYWRIGEVYKWVAKKRNLLHSKSLSLLDWDIKYTTHPGVYWSAD